MQSFQPSRGRILFEVFCALAIAASFVGAWKQTGAWTLLPAALAAAVYALFHAFDMAGPKQAAEPQRIDFEPPVADIVVPMVPAEELPADEAVAPVVAEVVQMPEPASREGSGRRTGGSRKGNGRRGKSAKAVKVEEAAQVEVAAQVEEAEAPWPVADIQEVADPEPVAEEEFVFPDNEEPSQPHIAPLFEPEPFARMQRRAFGRRGRL